MDDSREVAVPTTEALREIMKRREVRPAVLADRLGINPNVLSERFRQKNVSVSKLNEMLHQLGYQIVLMPDEAEVPEGGFPIK